MESYCRKGWTENKDCKPKRWIENKDCKSKGGQKIRTVNQEADTKQGL